MRTAFLGLNGFRTSGKSTLAAILTERNEFVCLQFADALYAETAAAFGLSVPQFARFKAAGHDVPVRELSLARCINPEFRDVVLRIEFEGDSRPMDEILAQPRSYRRSLQLYGTDYRRAQDSLYWVKKLDEAVSRHPGRAIVIADVRYGDEWKYVENQGGVVGRIINPRVEREMRDKIAAGVPEATHSSEIEIIDWPADFTLINTDGAPEQMYEQFLDLAQERGWKLTGSDEPRRTRLANAA